MKYVLGIFFDITQGPNKGGIVHAFDVFSDGNFCAPDMGKFGLKLWSFKEMFSYWRYANLDDGDNEYQ